VFRPPWCHRIIRSGDELGFEDVQPASCFRGDLGNRYFPICSTPPKIAQHFAREPRWNRRELGAEIRHHV
jgi:hypothetical protein